MKRRLIALLTLAEGIAVCSAVITPKSVVTPFGRFSVDRVGADPGPFCGSLLRSSRWGAWSTSLKNGDRFLASETLSTTSRIADRG
jgi:hypothetical protein